MAQSQQTLLVIDGHSLAFRAFFALPAESFRLESGVYTNAVHGFLSMLLTLLEHEAPTHLAVAFDLGRHSFRTEEYPEYKGTRPDSPVEFHGQVESLQDALRAMRITVVTKENYEGDDILATLSARGVQAGMRVLVVSGDRDSFQLITDQVTVLYPVRGVSQLKRYTPEELEKKYGVPPQHYPDIAALVGEKSDNLPGVPGVGPKTAARWIQRFGGVEEILAHRDEISGKVGASLSEHVDDVLRNRHLNRLVRDLELPLTLDELRIREVDHQAVDDVFGRLQLRTMRARVQALDSHLRRAPGAQGGQVAPEVTQASTSTSVVTEEPPASRVVDAEAASTWLTAHASEPLGLDLETVDGALASLGIAAQHEAIAVAWTPEAPEFRPVLDWLAASSRSKIVHASKGALKTLWAAGAELQGIAGDPLLSWFLVDSARSDYSLEASEPQFFEASITHPAEGDLLSGPGTPDCALRAWESLRLDALLQTILRNRGGLHVLTDIELPLSPVLAAMERTGIAVSREQLSELCDTLQERAAGIASEAYKAIGHEVNLASPKQLQTVLFDELGMPKTRATKTGYSTNAAALESLYERTEHPFLQFLLAHRDATKLAQMVVTLLRSVAEDGRIHTTYLQTGAATGRLSSLDPNLQNIPVRSEEGRHIRDAFVVGEGYETLISADYSQIEMRIMAHLSRDEGLIEAFRSGEDLHRYVGSKVFGVPPAEVTDAMRSKVKAMSYGLVYGLSAFGLSRQLRISREEAKSLMSGYFQRFGGVRDYLREVVERARTDGYTETIHGRRRPFPDLSSHNRVLRDNAERAALNAPIQGSAADIMKLAMLRVDRALRSAGLRSRTLLQVHDELILEVAPGETDAVRELVTAQMEGAADLSVPLEVHIGIGPTWAKAAH
ncbi:MAG: DNA polymerase I [Microbacteriaceae bacterium]|jgi:DNA polymerase-1|nr:DNA polymerase I [Microbacteriaceae bacterium]MCI1206737.1 DNA polymerase I [Microbacteriaceae bacterium]